MKRKFKGLFFDYFAINFGLILAAIGIGIFLVPGKLVSSGIPGVATILFYGYNIPIAITMLIFNIPIFLLGVYIFGKEYGTKTMFGIIGLAFYTQIFQTLLNNVPVVDYTKGGNLLLAPIFGGMFLGAGLGIIFRFGGSTGGSDILGQVISKFVKVPVAYAMLTLDALVIGTGILVFGIESGLYAILSSFITNLVLNQIFDGRSYRKMVYIKSTQHKRIQKLLYDTFDTYSTIVQTEDSEKYVNRRMVMVILKNKQIRDLQLFIHRIDPTAFVVISEVFEIIGTPVVSPSEQL
ncbi:MAG: YitT family protein [Psychrilyobacter sp.]|nr:YitT family protein [Psychrilyobacter sp.]